MHDYDNTPGVPFSVYSCIRMEDRAERKDRLTSARQSMILILSAIAGMQRREIDRRRWILAGAPRMRLDAEITHASITHARGREGEREGGGRGKSEGEKRREAQHLKSRACTLILDSRNLYDLYSITRALGRSYVTARFFRADPARGLFAATYTRARFVKLCEATRREARGRVRCPLYITHLILWL